MSDARSDGETGEIYVYLVHVQDHFLQDAGH